MKAPDFSDRAKSDLAALDRPTRLRIVAAIQRLAESNAGDIRKLQGIDPPEFRLRIGDWRVRFSYVEPATIRINRVLNRKDAYRP